MDFEKNYILKCLECLEQILTQSAELEKAINYYTENKSPHPRHQLNSKITEAALWYAQDKLFLSAAVFETIARISTLHYSENEEQIKKITAANTAFIDQYLPEMTKNTCSYNRINSVKENCRQIRISIKNNATNPYLFFASATAVVAVLAATSNIMFSTCKNSE
jgi:hypothetical protein